MNDGRSENDVQHVIGYRSTIVLVESSFGEQLSLRVSYMAKWNVSLFEYTGRPG